MEDDDLSTLGGDDFLNSPLKIKENGEEVMDELKPAPEEYEMVVNGFRCPDEYTSVLTPMEFEEMVKMFQEYDVDGSGTIDKHEARKILNSLGMDSSLEQAEELLNIVDTDQSGEIDFDEFCTFIIMLKRGDERMTKYQQLLTNIRNTPLGNLEHQCELRELKMQFVTIEEREPTAMHPALFVVELRMSGLWYEMVEGKLEGTFQKRIFQGIGSSTRLAKEAAASAATLKLQSFMPGVKYKEGTFPPEWIEWTDENLSRGVSPFTILDILTAKGFHAYLNLPLMHRIIAWHSFDIFLANNPDFDIFDVATLDIRFQQWVKDNVSIGIDGEIMYKMLADRCIDLMNEFVHFAQKLRNNELPGSTIMGKDGENPLLMDFYEACRLGQTEIVKLYCECNQPVNEENLGRYTSDSLTPLALAARGNHWEVMQVLLDRKADVNHIDRRGRTALHHAAMYGAAKACEILMDHGARLFAGDHMGQTALHFAAMGNHFETVHFLAFKGQEFVRAITSDKVLVKKGSSFMALCEEVFEEMQSRMLASIETRRFEKTWLNETTKYFSSCLDSDVSHMLAPSCPGITDDILARFDPRPETGIYILKTGEGDSVQVFIPTIPSAAELAVLLKYTFKQTSLDTVNNLGRSALHVACDANKINSHEKSIVSLIDVHGANVHLQDRYRRTPMMYLMADRKYANAPSATQVREEMFFEKRQMELDKISKAYDDEQAAKTATSRQLILDECIRRACDLSHSVWEATRIASVLKDTIECADGVWEYYEDPDTLNNFYCKQPVDLSESDAYTDFIWGTPPQVCSVVNRKGAFTFYRYNRCKLLRKIGRWEMYLCLRTGCNLYYDPESDKTHFLIPFECRFRTLTKYCESVRKLGFGNEWEEMRDTKHNLTFYRNTVTRDCVWDRPYEAIEITPNERFCTAYQNKERASEQKYFTCEQCNNAIKSSGGASNTMIKICEPCVFRCHRGHKGIRYIRTGVALCSCLRMCEVINGCCNARTISANQIERQRRALDMQGEVKRKKEHNALMPLVFAPVPRYQEDGSLKKESGWMLCRRTPPQGLLEMGNVWEEESSAGEQLQLPGSPTTGTKVGSELALLRPGSPGNGSIVSAQSTCTATGSLVANVNPPDEYLNSLQNSDIFPYEEPLGLPRGWIEVVDVEDPEFLPVGARVLVECFYEYNKFGPPKVYGNIVALAKVVDMYIVKFATDNNDYTVHRNRIELITRKTFFCNPETGQSAWTIDEANECPQESTTLCMTGPDWMKVYDMCLPRREFYSIEPPYEELTEPYSKAKLFVDLDKHDEELAAIKLQNIYRTKHRKPRPTSWQSVAFTFDRPKVVFDYENTLSGWAYLRRRSSNIGEFKDIETKEWEEYVDSESAEFFYWQEDSNRYQWVKPEVPKRVDPNAIIKDLYKIGDEVMFKFRGYHTEEKAVVTAIRFDDQDGSDMYDLEHKFKPQLKAKWASRKLIKPIPKEGDDLMLMRMEIQWKALIRRRKEADHREAKRVRRLKIEAEAEKARLREAVAPKGKFSNLLATAGKATFADKAKARVCRAQREMQDVLEEKDKTAGELRRERGKILLEEMKEANPHRLTRSDVLCMQRAIDMKLKFEDRIKERDAMQVDLDMKKVEASKRVEDVEVMLRDKEMNMTTPRSLVRRRLMRKMHAAMKRQSDMYVICEWGCGDWIRLGQEQIDHQQKRCTKRILPCTLGCPVRLSEEEWLRPHKELTVEEKEAIQNTQTVEDAAIKMDGITFRQYHEMDECPKRLVACPRQCLEWICAEVLEFHMEELCTKRPAKPVFCRLGDCGKEFGDRTIEGIIQAEEDRMMHEQEECPYRMVRCNWTFEDGTICASQLEARNRDEHRDYHLEIMGTRTFCVAGVHLYKIPKGLKRVKIQAWGGGGGSGVFKGRQCGAGGGAAYVEAILEVDPYDVLEIVVGSGGQGGVFGTEIEAVDIHEQRRQTLAKRKLEMYDMKRKKIEAEAKEKRLKEEIARQNAGKLIKSGSTDATVPVEKEKVDKEGEEGEEDEFQDDSEEEVVVKDDRFKDGSKNIQFDVIDSKCGVANGGTPGGGMGYGGGGLWAAGGGGGYTIIAKRSALGNQALIVAAGGGGGSSMSGLPGSGLYGPSEGTRIDMRNGCTATCNGGGSGGDSGNIYNSAWPAQDGEMWQGGNASQFGAGGGGGYFGGGGGGTVPGIGGGGGGGASFVHSERVFDYLIIEGDGHLPGGLKHNPCKAVGMGEWDVVGGWSGQGGRTSLDPETQEPTTFNGNNGCVRVIKPGFY